MQEHTNKDQDFSKARRANPIHIVEGLRQGVSNAEALRDVHMSLVRAEQNLYNLVQASHSNGAAFPASYGFAASPAYPAGFAPGFAPPAPIPGTTGLGYAIPATPWAQAAPWATPAPAISAWNPLAGAYGSAAAQGILPGTVLGPIAGRTPACDITDEGKNFVCLIDMPGIQADQVELLCTEFTVVVSALREPAADVASLVRAERTITPQQRTIVLPSEILPGGAKASLSDGVLTVTLPKAHPTEGPRRVKVQG